MTCFAPDPCLAKNEGKKGLTSWPLPVKAREANQTRNTVKGGWGIEGPPAKRVHASNGAVGTPQSATQGLRRSKRRKVTRVAQVLEGVRVTNGAMGGAGGAVGI